MIGEKPRAIVADDDPGIRKLLRDLLKKSGYDVTVCAGGEEALDAAAEGEEPDVLLTDLLMPGMSGLDLIRALRLRHLRMPILLMSGDANHPKIPAALSHSGVELLQKPFGVAECRRAVARAVGVRR